MTNQELIQAIHGLQNTLAQTKAERDEARDVAVRACGALIKEFGNEPILSTDRWTPPSAERTEMKVHPSVRLALRKALQHDPRLHGVGYSEFIQRALASIGCWPEPALEEYTDGR